MRDAIAAAELTQRGRGNFGAGFRSRAVGKVVEKTLDDAAVAGSGFNFENRLRQNLKSASRADEFQGFSPGEKADVKRFIRGVSFDNMLRALGNRLGGGGGVVGTGLAGGGGAAAGYAYGQDPWTAAAGGLAVLGGGRALRGIANQRIQNKVEAFQEKLRQRSPEYISRLAAAPTAPGPGLPSTMAGLRQALTIGDQGAIRDALARMLIYQSTGRRD